MFTEFFLHSSMLVYDYLLYLLIFCSTITKSGDILKSLNISTQQLTEKNTLDQTLVELDEIYQETQQLAALAESLQLDHSLHDARWLSMLASETSR